MWINVLTSNLKFTDAIELAKKEGCYIANPSFKCLYFYKNNVFYILQDSGKLIINPKFTSLNGIHIDNWMIVIPTIEIFNILLNLKTLSP